MSDQLYYKYLESRQLYRKYQELYNKIEEEDGVLDEETEIILYQIEDDISILLWELLQIIDNFDSEKKVNKERVKNLERINASIERQTEFIKKFVQTLVKKKGELNKSKNRNTKVGERSVTVVKSKVYNVNENFSDKRFIKFNINKIPAEYMERVENFFKQRDVEISSEKIILKKELNQALKEGEVIEGVEEEDKEHITIK